MKIQTLLRRIHRKFGRKGESIWLNVEYLDNKPYIGLCEKVDGGWRITIDADAEYQFQIHLLIHEYAHTMSADYDRNHHGASWGVAYATVYSYVYDDTLLTPKRRKRKIPVGRTS